MRGVLVQALSSSGITSQFQTDVNGYFGWSNLVPGSSYTITPFLSGSSFSPASVQLPALPAAGLSTGFQIISCVTVTAISPITPASSGTAIIGADGTIGFMLSVTAPSPACSWQVSLPDKWITPHGTLGGAGSGTFYVDIASNATGAQRNSIIQVSGAAFTISQQPYIQVFGTGIVTTKPNLSFLQDGLLDPHYTITSEPAGISKPSATNSYVVNSSYYPSTAWFPNNQAKWITPELPVANLGLAGVPPGTYTYQTTFDLTGFILSTVTTTGRWGADDLGIMTPIRAPAALSVINLKKANSKS